MITVLNDVKDAYRADSIQKNYFVFFRDYKTVLTNSEIVQESLSITESICSSGNFKVGLCESATANIDVALEPNVKGDEMTIMQTVGSFEPEITISDDYGVRFSGEGVTQLYSNATFDASGLTIYDSNTNFESGHYYIFALRLDYVGDEIYIYSSASSGPTKTLYYLKEDSFGFKDAPDWSNSGQYVYGAMVKRNTRLYKNIDINNTYNTTDPATSTTWEDITKSIQVIIPVIGENLVNYKLGLWSAHASLTGAVSVYEINVPVMPLGLFSIFECKRKNDTIVRTLRGYDRMQDVQLEETIVYSGTAGGTSTIGSILDQAAADTQIRIGSNRTKERMEVAFLDESVEQANITSDPIYQTAHTEYVTVWGTPYDDDNGSHVRKKTKNVSGTYRWIPVRSSSLPSSTIKTTWYHGNQSYTTQEQWWTNVETGESIKGTSNNNYVIGEHKSLNATGYWAYYVATDKPVNYDLTSNSIGNYVYACVNYTEAGFSPNESVSGWHISDDWVQPPQKKFATVSVSAPARAIQSGDPFWWATGYSLQAKVLSGSSSAIRKYHKEQNYSFSFNPPSGWTYVQGSERFYYPEGVETEYQARNTEAYGTCSRVYTRYVTDDTWYEPTMDVKTLVYGIPGYSTGGIYSYLIEVQPPQNYGVYINENTIVKNGVVQQSIRAHNGSLVVNRQQTVRNAIVNNSTRTAVGIETDTPYGNYGVFEVKYIENLNYNGASSGIVPGSPPSIVVYRQLDDEAMASENVTWNNATATATRRSVIASYLELNGLFINFDRYGVSTFLNITMSTLYPALDLFPHTTGIYPTQGADEYIGDGEKGYCKSLYVDDILNAPFDGVEIIKSNPAGSEASLYPFYYNRPQKRYGVVPASMPEIGKWPGNKYYVIKSNFFIDNFIFTSAQLKAICQTIIKRVGDLQYFNLNADLKCLPYMEVGDSINIVLPKGGYETVILRRTMNGCINQMDNYETNFYADGGQYE